MGTLGWYMAYASDAMVIGALATPSDIAYFGLAANVMVILGGISGAFVGTFMPMASELDALDDRERLRNVYLLGSRVSLMLTAPAILVFLLDGPELLSLWVGPAIGVPAGRLLRILALAHLPVIANGPGVQIALGKGLLRPAAAFSVLEGLANLALSVALGLRWGAAGVATATMAVSFAVHGAIWPAFMRDNLGIRARRYWAESVFPAAMPLVPALIAHSLCGLLSAGPAGRALPPWLTVLIPPAALA